MTVHMPQFPGQFAVATHGELPHFCRPQIKSLTFQWRDGRISVIFRCRNSFKLLFLCSCVTLAFTQAPIAKSQQAFAITVVTSSDDQFWTNSVIVEGTHEVML